MKNFPHYKQINLKDCGPVCLRIVAKHYGKYIDFQELREKCGVTKTGTSFYDLSIGSESIGLKGTTYNLDFNELKKIALPCIIHWKAKHFVVVYKITSNKVFVSDPAISLVSYDIDSFLDSWRGRNERGAVLGIEILPEFYASDKEQKRKTSYLANFINYLIPYKKNLIQLLVVMFAVTIAQALLPFITRSIIDIGVDKHDYNFLKLIIIGQGILLFSILLSNALRNWILTHVTSRINVNMLSNYIIKLMKMPLNYFENRTIGDTLQRAGDHERIQNFIVNSSVTIIFSFLTFIVYGIILFFFDVYLFLIFSTGVGLFLLWTILFQKSRKLLDISYFELNAKNRGHWIEMLTTMPDIKINNLDKKKRWDWERVQAGLYKVNLKLLSINQTQDLGGQFIVSMTNLLLTFYSARAVINGELSLGVMLSIQYIVGQLSGPITQVVPFIRSAQFADFSFQRLNEIQYLKDEESVGGSNDSLLQLKTTITVRNLLYKYSANETPVMKNINLIIPEGKITAIVGQSGSGKTTLLKLLMGLYYPSFGEILIGNTLLSSINPREWRSKYGAVLQDGKIFNDTLLNNIVLDAEDINYEWLEKIIDISSIRNIVDQLPQRLNTWLGDEGIGLSHGQKQRILIARALYRNPSVLFMDEATNSLDSYNENLIVSNLDKVFENKTVVIAAHRLSTVQRANQIVVLHNGSIVELGSHESLVKKKGLYYKLFEGQLTLHQ